MIFILVVSSAGNLMVRASQNTSWWKKESIHPVKHLLCCTSLYRKDKLIYNSEWSAHWSQISYLESSAFQSLTGVRSYPISFLEIQRENYWLSLLLSSWLLFSNYFLYSWESLFLPKSVFSYLSFSFLFHPRVNVISTLFEGLFLVISDLLTLTYS